MFGFLDFHIENTTYWLTFAAVLGGTGALLSGWAALIRARAQGRKECGCAKEEASDG